MTLKEQIAADLEDGAVWFDENDFADWHDVNGARVLCILDSMKTAPERIGRFKGGVHSGSSFLFICAGEFARCPKPEEPIDIDGARCRILNVTDDLGVYVIEYKRYDDAKIRN